MEVLREWIVSLVAVSLLIAIVQSLTSSGAVRRAADFVCALALLAALLRPLPGLKWESLLPDGEDYAEAAAKMQREMEETQTAELEDGIAERTASYISDKARCAVRVETKVEGGVPLPWRVELEREYEKGLSNWIFETVGIPEERQAWHGVENRRS